MARHASGVFVRNDRKSVTPGTTVRLFSLDRKHSVRAELLALGAADLVLSALRPSGLALGCKAQVAVVLPGRYIELELPCVVDWENGASFGVSLGYLSARQAYGFALLRDLLTTEAGQPSLPARVQAARR
jgi:hypothetical protein